MNKKRLYEPWKLYRDHYHSDSAGMYFVRNAFLVNGEKYYSDIYNDIEILKSFHDKWRSNTGKYKKIGYGLQTLEASEPEALMFAVDLWLFDNYKDIEIKDLFKFPKYDEEILLNS